MPQVLSQGNCGYTVLNTAGTTTLNPGPSSGPPIQPGVLFGAQVTSVGTSFVITMVDIVGTTTNTLVNGTATAIGQQFPAGVPGVGVRYRGALVAIVTGTPGAYVGLWD